MNLLFYNIVVIITNINLLMNKILYIGTGLHLDPLFHFTKTKEFVFVDVQPRSEFDKPDSFFDGFYRKSFYSNLIKKAKEYNFILEKTEEFDSGYFSNLLSFKQRVYWFGRVKETFPYICPTLLIFYNYKTGQKLKYYISTNILYNMNFNLENDIKGCEGLIIAGYHPDKVLLKYISSNPINLYCYTNTCYKINEDEVDNKLNLIYWLFNNLDKVSKYFSNIYMVKQNGNMILCENISHMDTIVKNNYTDKQ